MRNIYQSTLLVLGILCSSLTYSQGVAINNDGSNADASSMLDIKSTNSGMLIPRMTQAQRNSIGSPVTSLLIYQTDNTPGFYYYDGSTWTRLSIGSDNFDDADADPSNEFQTVSISGHDITLSDGGGTVTVPDANTTYSAGNQLSLSGTTFNVTEGSGSGLDADLLDGHEWSEVEANDDYLPDDPATSNVDMNDFELQQVKALQGKDWDDNTGGADNKYRLLWRDGAHQFYNGGVVVGSYGNGTWTDLTDGRLIVEDRIGIATTAPLLNLDVRGRTIIGNAFTPTTSNDDNVLNLNIGSTSTGSANGISFYENTSGFSMKLGYDGTGSGATNKMAIYSNSNSELVTFENGGEIGIGVTAPNNDLDVNGNAQISEYLLVGNPGAPSTTASGGDCTLYGWNGAMGFAGWTTENVCGNSGSVWQMIIANSYDDYLEFDNAGSYSLKRLYTPWIWVPSNATNVELEAQFYCNLENNYDGVYLEYTTNGSTWTKITSFSHDGYPDNASGSNGSCNGTNSQACWNGSTDDNSATSTGFTATGTWVRFRFVGNEDNSNSSGSFQLFGFALNCNMPSFGGSFANGNIYAQNNVYAGSNVLLGDLAEYFNVIGGSEAGDIITMSKMTASYAVSQKAYDNRIIGVHSTNPTLTLNDPRAGDPVALTGRVPVKVTVTNGKIQKGDYLTSSNTPGTAMKADKPCYVLGKALEDAGKNGKILCLIQPGYYNPIPAESFRKSGSIEITKGSKQVVVNDPAIGNDSRIFLTMTGNPGSYYWIQEKLPGKFSIAFASGIPGDITCEYLIEGALNENEKEYISQINADEGLLFDQGKGTYYTKENIPPCTNCSAYSLPLYEGISAPPVPEKTDRLYQWTKENGVISLPMLEDKKERVYPENDGIKQ